MTLVRQQQCDWARGRGLPFDSAGYTLELADNLFIPLSAPTRQDLRGGDGDELGRDGARGKMQALHSSSAMPRISTSSCDRHRAR